jgi:shikimate dehydrogenase
VPTRRAALLGRPVAHSLSPTLHRAAYAALGLDWTYEAIDCDQVMLPDVLVRSGPQVAGYSCTMPLKRAALALASCAGPDARVVGAANTLRPARDGWQADNTDVTGIRAALASVGAHPRQVTLLGAGGTAQAAVVAVAQLGLGECAVLVRNPAHTEALAATAVRIGVALHVGPLAGDAPELGADLVVSALPQGGADPVVGWPWRNGQVVLDAVYDPWPTPLATAAAQGGAVVVSGAAMLLHQATAQVELMTGCSAPIEAMRDALRRASPGCGA